MVRLHLIMLRLIIPSLRKMLLKVSPRQNRFVTMSETRWFTIGVGVTGRYSADLQICDIISLHMTDLSLMALFLSTHLVGCQINILPWLVWVIGLVVGIVKGTAGAHNPENLIMPVGYWNLFVVRTYPLFGDFTNLRTPPILQGIQPSLAFMTDHGSGLMFNFGFSDASLLWTVAILNHHLFRVSMDSASSRFKEFDSDAHNTLNSFSAQRSSSTLFFSSCSLNTIESNRRACPCLSHRPLIPSKLRRKRLFVVISDLPHDAQHWVSFSYAIFVWTRSLSPTSPFHRPQYRSTKRPGASLSSSSSPARKMSSNLFSSRPCLCHPASVPSSLVDVVRPSHPRFSCLQRTISPTPHILVTRPPPFHRANPLTIRSAPNLDSGSIPQVVRRRTQVVRVIGKRGLTAKGSGHSGRGLRGKSVR